MSEDYSASRRAYKEYERLQKQADKAYGRYLLASPSECHRVSRIEEQRRKERDVLETVELQALWERRA